MKLQRVLMLKMSGEDVRYMQGRLKELGFHKGRIDGNFSQETLVSVSNFQRDAGFKSDGVVSLQTWSRIVNYEKSQEKIQDDKEIPFDVAYVSDDGLKIYDSKLSEDYFYKSKSKKNTVWIKSTLSDLKPDDYIGNWGDINNRDKEGNILDEKLKTSTHYLIGGFYKNDTKWDGQVIRNFEDKFWSYHSPFLTTTKRLNQSSVSIEICNLGPLLKINNDFYTKSGILVDETQVVEVDFRGYKYWHRYTKSQIESLRKLLIYLKSNWKIDLNKNIIDDEWFEFHKKWNSVDGIRTDSQISYGDVGIFPQKDLIEMLNNL